MKRRIKTDYLARVEGEGGFLIEIEDGRISNLKLRIFEAPRYFEAFLRGRPCTDVIDFTARICGICPVAYQMTSVHAIEKIFGVPVSDAVKRLRRLLYCGEWISSHALHVYLLHGPDFFGLPSAFADSRYLETARRGLRLKKTGNDLMAVIGGRPIHPVSVRIGGFFSAPSRQTLLKLLSDIERGYEESIEGIRWASSLPFEEGAAEPDYVSLHCPPEYPMNDGRVIAGGPSLTMAEFFDAIEETQAEYSTALHSVMLRNGALVPYRVGPVSRLNLNFGALPSEIIEVLRNAGVSLPLRNGRMSIVARSVELAYSLYEAARIIKDYEEPDRPFEEYEPKAGSAVWATEAPRGLLVHRYELDDRGRVRECAIIPPTSQNLAQMERDIRAFVEGHMGERPELIKSGAEKIIRGYDPCISCSTHLVDLRSKAHSA